MREPKEVARRREFHLGRIGRTSWPAIEKSPKTTRSEAGLDSGLGHFVSAKIHKFKTLRAENFGKENLK
jgi:hypothetical protein